MAYVERGLLVYVHFPFGLRNPCECRHTFLRKKSQLTRVVNRENYKDAVRLKVAIAAATTNDTVGIMMSHLNKAIEEERYEDVAFIQDYVREGLDSHLAVEIQEHQSMLKTYELMLKKFQSKIKN